jgi:hypothetical protein
MAPPEIHLRMHDEPVERDRQLQEQNNGGEPARQGHTRILVEPARAPQSLSSPRTSLLATSPAKGAMQRAQIPFPWI